MAPRKQRLQKSLSQPSTSVAHVDLEDDFNVPASQISPDKNLTAQEHAHHVSNVVKYILSADHSKIPITKSAISKAVNCHNKNFQSIMDSVLQVLRDVFGYDLIESDGKLIVFNNIKNNLSCLDFPEDITNRYVILFLILAHIYMSGECCTQGSIVQFFIELNIVTDGNMKSDVFGDILDMITVDFVKEKYLEIEKSENTETEEPEFRWGLRAEQELSRRTVMEFVSKVYRGKSMQSWPQQYEKMLQKEKQTLNRTA